MKIGNIHITWMSARQEEILRLEIREHLRDVEARQIVAKIARSEVKNYLAECAERAQIPYIDAESLLARLEERAQLLEVEAEALGVLSSKMRAQFDLEQDFVEAPRPEERM